MAYTKKTWKNSETKLSASNLNDIETGLESAAKKADDAAAQASANLSSINGHTTAINGLTTSLNSLTTTVNNNKTNADSKFTSVENRIAAAEQVNNTQNSTISTLGTEISRVEGKFDSSVASLTSGQSTTNTNLNNHKNAKNNPHEVTAAQVGAYSKDEINAINSADEIDDIIILPDDQTRDHTVNINNISKLPQKLLINTAKLIDSENGTGPMDTEYSYAGAGAHSLWTLDYDTSVDLYNLAVDGAFGYDLAAYSSGFTFDFIKKDINGEDIIDYNSSYNTTIPDNYLSTMYYIYPVYVHGSSGFSLEYDDTDASFSCFITLIFESASQNKLYLVPVGVNGGLYERLMFSIVSDRYLLIKGNYVFKRVVDLKAYGDDLVFHSMGFHYISTSGTLSLHPATPTYPSFTLYTNTGAAVTPTTALLSTGTYEVEITPSSDFDYLIYRFTNSNIRIGISNSVQYAPDNSNLMSLGRNIPSSIDMDKLNRDVELKAQLAVKQLINVGTSDPSANTPGLLYFKYLP